MPEFEKELRLNVGEKMCPCGTHEGREMVNIVFGYTVDQAFELLFMSSTFMKEFNILRKTANFVQTPWIIQQGLKVRQVSYMLQVGIGLTVKIAKTLETQTIMKGSQAGVTYSVNIDVVTIGLPYGDTFYTLHRHCLTRVSPTQCRLCIHSQIMYRKSVWGVVKSFIERNVWNGIAEFYKEYEAHLWKEVTRNELPKKPIKMHRRRREVNINMLKLTSNNELNEDSDENHATMQFLGTQHWGLSPIGDNKRIARWKWTTKDIQISSILLLLILLLAVNALLFYNVWVVQTFANRQLEIGHISCFINPEMPKQPLLKEDWLNTCWQKAFYPVEMNSWECVLETVITHLQKVHLSVINLKMNIQAHNSHQSNKDAD